MSGSVWSVKHERFDLADRNALVPDAGDGPEHASGEEPVDRGFADAEGAGGFVDRIGQPAHAVVGDNRSKRIGLRCHGIIIPHAPGFEKRSG